MIELLFIEIDGGHDARIPKIERYNNIYMLHFHSLSENQEDPLAVPLNARYSATSSLPEIKIYFH